MDTPKQMPIIPAVRCSSRSG